mmetsp:Transcript_62185/g.153003  ORF Transcript_62185/g.153003 Transcript_62185/m.153003 type:complete len:254 (+) Transcript_62185:144-905(+)
MSTPEGLHGIAVVVELVLTCPWHTERHARPSLHNSWPLNAGHGASLTPIHKSTHVDAQRSDRTHASRLRKAPNPAPIPSLPEAHEERVGVGVGEAPEPLVVNPWRRETRQAARDAARDPAELPPDVHAASVHRHRLPDARRPHGGHGAREAQSAAERPRPHDPVGVARLLPRTLALRPRARLLPMLSRASRAVLHLEQHRGEPVCRHGPEAAVRRPHERRVAAEPVPRGNVRQPRGLVPARWAPRRAPPPSCD